MKKINEGFVLVPGFYYLFYCANFKSPKNRLKLGGSFIDFFDITMVVVIETGSYKIKFLKWALVSHKKYIDNLSEKIIDIKDGKNILFVTKYPEKKILDIKELFNVDVILEQYFHEGIIIDNFFILKIKK